VGAGIGTIAGAITYAARHISHELPDTDVKSAAKDPKSLIMKSHTETRQPPDLVEPLFPGTHLQPHSNVPIELISPQHRDPSVQLTAHWSGDRSLGITDPGFRVITPAVQGEKITEHGRQGMHTFLTNDNHIITNGHLDSETAGRLDKLGFKPKEIVDSNFTPNARLGKHGQVDSFKLDSVKWDFNGNRVTLTELDLRPQADVVNNISDHMVTTFLQQDKAGHVYFDNLDLLKTPTAGHDHSMYDVLIADKWQERDGKLWAPDISTEYIPMTQTITVNEPKVDNMIALGGMAAIGVAAGIKNRDKIIPIGKARKQRKEQERAKKQLETDKQMEERMNWDIASKLNPNRPAVLSPDEIQALRVQQIDAFAQTINPSLPSIAEVETKPFEEQHPIWNGFFMEANPYQNRIPIIQNRPHQISLYDVLHITDPLNPDPAKMPKEYVIALLSKLAAADQEFQNTQKVASFDRLLTDIQGQGYEVEFEFQPNLQPGSVDLANHLITLNLSEKPANLFYYLRELLQLFQQAAA
jgi:hypothetical protein